MLNKESKYAIRGIIYLAMNASKKNKLGSKEVGEKIQVPLPFLAKIFQHLSKENLISSAKGPRGGFYLTEEQLSGNLLSIIASIDGLENFKTCFLGLPSCSDNNPCAIHHINAEFRERMLSELKKRSIADFAKDPISGKSSIF